MTGALWAAMSGVAFGLFQVVNARAMRGAAGIYRATFYQLSAATVVVAAVAAVTDDLGDLVHMPVRSLVLFALAGCAHFMVGWTALSISHVRIGASRTSPLLATTPLFGLAFAVVADHVLPGWVALLGIAVTVVGAYLVNDPGPGRRAAVGDSAFGLATAAAWSLSAVLTVAGLQGFDEPVLGVVASMAAASAAYGVLLLVGPRQVRRPVSGGVLAVKLGAGMFVAVATWWRWLALDEASVSVVLALQLLTVPTVLVLAPLVRGADSRRASAKTWRGAGLVLAGAFVLIVVS